MKQYIYIAIIFLTVYGCADFETRPQDKVPSNLVFQNKKGLESALTGSYNILQRASIAMDATLFADVIADNMVHQGTKKEYRQLSDNQLEASNDYINSLWLACYDGISRVNFLLDNIEIPQDLTESERKRIEGEARFIRAYLYSILVKYFGGVPLRKQPVKTINETELYIERTSDTAIYQFITDELISIQNLLEGTDADEKSLASEGATKALLARVYLYNKNYSLANSKASEVLEMDYSLEDTSNFTKIFSEEEPSNEIIFQIDFNNDDEAINEIADWTQPFGRFELSAWANAAKENSIALEMDTTDWRYSTTVQEDVSGDYYCNKYSTINKDNIIVLRLAEMYLIKAEALNELSFEPAGEALALLNIIRQRAGLELYEAGELDNQVKFREAIIKERRFEFAFEGHRLFDLKRSGLINAVLPQDGNMSENDWLLPIPQSELDANPLMDQNGTY